MINNFDKVDVVLLDLLEHGDQDMLLVVNEGLLSDYTTTVTCLVLDREPSA